MKKITLLILCILFSALGFAQLQVGSGTNEDQNMPIDPFYAYTYSQSIYTADEINTSGTITGIQYYFSGTSPLSNSQDLTIYIGHTTKSAFQNTQDWESVSNLTTSYTGDVPVSGPGWITLTLDIPFVYNGTDNLIIACDENMAGFDSSSDDFWNTATTENRSITYRSDGINPNPAAPPIAIATYPFVPTIIFDGLPALDVNDLDRLRFTYFPNPVNDQLTLKSQSTIDNIKIYSLLGQEILNKDISAKEANLDVSSLQSGTYISKITIGDKTTVVKVLKN